MSGLWKWANVSAVLEAQAVQAAALPLHRRRPLLQPLPLLPLPPLHHLPPPQRRCLKQDFRQ